MAWPREVEQGSLTTLREKLVKIGAKVVNHGRCVTFQLAEVAVPRPIGTSRAGTLLADKLILCGHLIGRACAQPSRKPALRKPSAK